MRLTQARRQEQAQAFIDCQQERIAAIEEDLHHATDNILPIAEKSMSVTELAELIRLIQESNRRQIEEIKCLLNAAGYEIPRDKNSMEQFKGSREEATFHWTLGRPLERVVEGDVESDGTTTPGSMGYQSPFWHRSSSTRKQSLTPTTPTMESISFSASTNSILRKSRSFELTEENEKTPRSSSEHSRNPHLEAFREDDDMITLDSQSTLTGKSHHSQNHSYGIHEDRASFFARMESMLERVEESIQESRPSDEIDNSIKGRSIDTSHDLSINKYHSNSFEFLDNNREDDTYGEDSTNVVPTIVAADKKNTEGRPPEPVPFEDDFQSENLGRPMPSMRRPTQIVVDNAMPSPAHTNITMDGTMMNDTMVSHSVFCEDDNCSTVTPILDRYRLDPDDNSIGVKVVPNKRGRHGHDNKYSEVPDALKGKGSIPPTTQTKEIRTPMNHTKLPGSVSARKKKNYRKTPYPDKSSKRNSVLESDENINPNFSSESSCSSAFSLFSKDSESRDSFKVPPLRPRSLEPKASQTHKTPTRSKAASLSSEAIFQPVSLTANLTNIMEKNVASNEKRIRSLEMNFESGLTSSTQDSMSHTSLKWIENITMAEYDRAPQVVKMQVTRDEVNIATSLLEKYLTKRSAISLQFTEHEAHKILVGTFRSDQKIKSVLLSLCHWRRLLMSRDEQNAMIFAVNQFEQ